MTKSILLSTTLLAAGLASEVQAQSTTQRCATDQMTQVAEQRFPEQIKASQARWQQIIDASLRKMDLSQFAKTTAGIDTTTVYHIPLVFHIIHNYGPEFTGVTDNQIFESVKEINELYNRVNSDTSDIIRPYKNLIPGTNVRYAGNTKFVFHLAQIDPQGRPTSGITRRRHYLTLKGGDLGKLDGWSPDAYVNIWVNRYLTNEGAAQYAYQPATVDGNPALKIVDGVMAGWQATTQGGQQTINYDNTIGHELGHVFSLAHPWGNSNDPGIACGDDGVFDTPPTMGHGAGAPTSPRNRTGCDTTFGTQWFQNGYNLFDTVCNMKSVFLGKPNPVYLAGTQIDMTNAANRVDTTANDGITFDAYSLFYIKNLGIYCGDSGKSYAIQITNGAGVRTHLYQDTFRVSKGSLVTVPVNFKVLAGKNYKISFLRNPGVYTDINTVVVPYRKISGVVYLTSPDTAVGQRYRYFYNWNLSHGNFRIYDSSQYRNLYVYGNTTTIPAEAVPLPDGGFLVDYPDTTNSQNVMDYTYCSKMFTAGQSERMRLAASSPIANRNRLSSLANLISTGIMDANGNILPRRDNPPVADFSLLPYSGSVEQIPVSSGVSNFGDVVYKCAGEEFTFINRTTGDTITGNGINWTFSNNATPATFSMGNNALPVKVKFGQPGWATVSLTATSNAGSDTEVRQPVYVADINNKVAPIGYFQDFNDANENARWPNFNYYNNDFKWEVANVGGYDQTSMKYNGFDYRYGVPNPIISLPGSTPDGDFDDFFSPPFDLTGLAGGPNLNINFLTAGASRSSLATDVRDVFQVFASTDCGNTWNRVATMNKRSLTNNGVVSTPFVPTGLWDWKAQSFDLMPLMTGNPSSIMFRFRYRPGVDSTDLQGPRFGTGNNFYIDRIHVSNNPVGVDDQQLDAQGMVLAPNPTTTGASIMLKNATGDVNILVSDITGKVVYQSKAQGAGARTTIEIPATALQARGIYFVQVATSNFSQTQKLVVN